MDIVFNEDKSPKKKDNASIKFNILRKIALAMIEKGDYIKKWKNTRRLKAFLEAKYRTKTITN